MTGPLDWRWPVTFRYRLVCPGWQSHQEMTLDLPTLEGNHDATMAFARLLWSLTMAAAINRSVLCATVEVMMWRAAIIPELVPAGGHVGQQGGTAAAQSDSVCFVLCTGGVGRYSRRKFFIPGTPEDWTGAGRVNRHGWEQLLAHARSLYMGLSPIPPDAQSTWLVAYPRAVSSSGPNFHGVGFREVRDIRVCQLVAKAPDAGFGIWP